MTKRKNQKLSGSEALYGFCAWLTTRKEKTIMGSSESADPIPKLIVEFCKANKLPDPRPHWETFLNHPKEETVNEGK